MYRVLLLLLIMTVSACASARPGEGNSPVDCSSGLVTVYAVNQTFADLRITFGNTERLEAAPAMKTTTYRGISRYDLRKGVTWKVARGGPQRAVRPTEGVDPICNEATLVILSGSSGILHGADVRPRSR
jgi:hypothetical protein